MKCLLKEAISTLDMMELNIFHEMYIWDKLFKNGPSKICGRQPIKNFTWSILEYFVLFIIQCHHLVTQ